MRNVSIAHLLFALSFLLGCTKSDPVEKTTVTLDHSVLKGMVFLYDEGWSSSDRSGMTVSVENSIPQISTTTNSKGEFSLKIGTSLKSFVLVYSKPLYGTYKEFYTRSGDSLYVLQTDYSDHEVKTLVQDNYSPLNPNLGLKSTTKVNSLRTEVINGQLKIICNVSIPNSGTTSERFVQLFYQKNNPISSFASIPKTSKNLSGMLRINNNGDNVLDFCMNCCLYGVAEMHNGDTVYMTAYGNSYFSGNYVDRSTNEVVFPNINLSDNVTPISFVLP